MSISKCRLCNPETEFFNILRACLPSDYEHIVCNFEGDASHFKTRIRTIGKNNNSAQKWLEDFQMHSKCTMRIDRTYPHSGTKNVFKVDLRCQHNTRPRSEKVREKETRKNTDCPAKMGITIKRVVTDRKSRSKDPHLPGFPTVIQMDFCHNHAILTPEILKHRSVLPDVKEKMLTLFKLGHNPATALDMHKYDLLLEHGENFEKICHDRALLPDAHFCYRLYYKIVRKADEANNEIPGEDSTSDRLPLLDKKQPIPLSSCENSTALHNSPQECLQISQDASIIQKKVKKKRKLESSAIDKNEMVKQLEVILCKFCESRGFAGMQLIENDTVIALCTPLMHRVHRLVKHSGDLVFVDSYGDLDEPNSCRVYMLVTYSCIGAVPLGCLITTSETPTCLKAALELWKQILPEGCFYNNIDGPSVFFTNDNETERLSLKSAFPKSQLLICLSHILQASWCFVWDRKNAVKKDHRSQLFSKIRLLLFSQTVEDLEMNYVFALSDSLVKLYPVFVDYLKHIYNHRHDWSLVYRRGTIPNATDVTFFWESAMIILKDPILSRARSYNMLQVIDFLSRLDTYYERKLIDLANSRFDCVRLSRFLFIELPREAYTITQNSDSEYEIHNDTKDTNYQIDITLGVCECRTGKSGAPCKHQLLVYRNFPVPVYDCIPPTTQAERNLIFQLATGQELEDVSEVMSDTITKAVQSAMGDHCQNQNEIVIQELSGCGDNFFMDESDTSLNPNNTASLVLHHTNAFIEATHIMEQHHNSISPDVLLEENLLTSINPNTQTTITLNSAIDSEMDQQLNQNETVPQGCAVTQAPSPPSPCSTMTTDLSTDSTSVTELLNHICMKLKERTSASPNIFKPALGTFLKNLDNLSAESSLEYALYTFGKFSKSATPFFKRKIVDNKLVGLQSAGESYKDRQLLKCSKLSKRNHES